jgi:hypothetical protein
VTPGEQVLEDLNNGLHDGYLDLIEEVIRKRRLALPKRDGMAVLTEASRTIQMAYMQSTEKKARLGVEAYKKIEQVLVEFPDDEKAKGYAQLLLRRVLVECLDMDETAARSMVDRKIGAAEVKA